MPKPKTKDIVHKGTETTAQRVKMQMRDAAGNDVSLESYGGDTIEDSAQYMADHAADGIREMGSSIKGKATEQIKERIERVRQREDGPDAQEPGNGHSSPQEPQSGRSYSEARPDAHTSPQEQPVDVPLDRSPRQRPKGSERIKTKDTYIRARGEAATPKEIQKKSVQVERTSAHTKGKAPDTPANPPDASRPSAYTNRPARAARRMEQSASKSVRQAGKRTVKTAEKSAVKTMRKGAIKTAKKGAIKTSRATIKTAEKSVKVAERTAHATAKVAQRAAQAAVRAAQAAARAAQAAAKTAVAAAKAAAKAAAALIKALIAAVKGLIAAIAAGGWVAVVIILAVALVAVILCACFGVFASNETEESNPMTAAILEIDTEFRAGIDAEIARLSIGGYDEIVVRYAGDMDGDSDYLINWNDVIAVYAVRVTMDDENPMDVLEVTPEKIEKLRETFHNMNTVEYDTEVIETEGTGAQVGDEDEKEAEPYRKLIITISVNSMDHLAGADLYNFTDEQREALAAMMEPQMLPMYAELIGVDLLGGFEGSITDIVSGLPVGEKGTEIVTAALTRLGHPYSQDYRGEGNYVDCSFLVQWAYRQAGISIPGTSVAQAQYCANMNIGQSELAPGDLVFWSKTTCDCGRWNEIHHVGIYIGGNRVIEASSSKGCVIVRELWGLGSGKWQVHSYGRPY